jgi:hypothetical protein
MERILVGLAVCAAAAGCARQAPTAEVSPAMEQVAKPAREAVSPHARRDARAEAAAIRDPEARLGAHERLLAEMLKDDPREAIAWLLGLEDRALAAVLMDQALAAWAAVDAPAAGAHVAALPESDYRTMLAGELAAAWAARDGAAATAWAAGLGDQEAREEALRGALGRVAENEPQRAAEMALRVTSEGDRAAAAERAIESWWTLDPAGVEAWAGRLADEKEKALVERLVAARREAEGQAAGSR